ncbi:MAG: RdgB/HAM1 family non-canonical purine NTP pyrophosphatase [Vulcanimicrobiaceae bacterium]
MLVYAATKNRGKLDELRAIFATAGWRIEDSSLYADVDEGTTSYEENAALKARALHATLAADGEAEPVIGDDSGLEITALAGRPGILSARYGGGEATWRQRRHDLLAEIARSGSADRHARFVCALHFITADGREFAVRESLDGSIGTAERGDGGFSYDAIFIPAGFDRSFAEVPAREKNRISHRARAARRLLEAVGTGAGKDDRRGM